MKVIGRELTENGDFQHVNSKSAQLLLRGGDFDENGDLGEKGTIDVALMIF